MQTWKIKFGINIKIFDVLFIKLNSLLPLKSQCINKRSLKTHLFYKISQVEIIGFEDTDNEKSEKPAKNALVIGTHHCRYVETSNLLIERAEQIKAYYI